MEGFKIRMKVASMQEEEWTSEEGRTGAMGGSDEASQEAPILGGGLKAASCTCRSYLQVRFLHLG